MDIITIIWILFFVGTSIWFLGWLLVNLFKPSKNERDAWSALDDVKARLDEIENKDKDN